MSSAVVVGGGVAGLLSALLLKRKFSSVTLLEKDHVCGGLFNSIVNTDGVSFDFGSHLLSDTGLPDLDALLYDGMDPQAWHVFHIVKTGNFFRGTMNRTSPFIDARSLESADFHRGFSELLATKPFGTEECQNLRSYLEHHVGPTFTRLIYAPVLMKQLGATLEELHPDTPFVLKRLVCADAEKSRRLKNDPFFDAKVAFTSYEEGAHTIRHRYPRSGGLGQWVRSFEKRLTAAGVEIRTGQTATGVEHRHGEVAGVTLDDGCYLPCDVLIWTIPPFFLLKAAGLGGSDPFTVKSRPIGLYHLVFDRPFLDENYYVTCYDDALRTFRVTLYPNTQGRPGQPPYNCTVEVIGDRETNFELLHDIVVDELVTMGMVERTAKRLSSDMRIVPTGFPATTHAFMKAATNQSAQITETLRNVLLLGRAKCPPFFTTDVLIEAYRKVGAICREYSPA